MNGHASFGRNTGSMMTVSSGANCSIGYIGWIRPFAKPETKIPEVVDEDLTGNELGEQEADEPDSPEVGDGLTAEVLRRAVLQKSAMDAAEKFAKDMDEAKELSKAEEKQDFDPKRRLQPPTKLFAGTDEEDVEGVLRNWRMWKEKYPKASDRALGRELMEACSGKMEAAIHMSIGEGSETFSSIYELAEKRFGWKALVKTTKVEMTYEKYERGNKKMKEFLEENDDLKGAAEQMGHRDCEKTSGLKLLRKAGLEAGRYSQCLTECLKLRQGRGEDVPTKERLMPTFDDARFVLEVIAESYEVGDLQKAQKKEAKAAFMSSLGGGKTDKKGKGNGQGDRNKK